MLTAMAGFAFRRYLRETSTYVYLAVLFGLGCLSMMAAGHALHGAAFNMGTGGDVRINSPFGIFMMLTVLSYFGLLLIAGVAGKAAVRDVEHNIAAFFYTAPIGKASYLGSRFIAAMLLLTLVFAAIGAGMAIGTRLPGIDRSLIGPNYFAWYLAPYVVVVIPNLIVMGSLFFAIGSLSRKMMPVYTAATLLLCGYMAAGSLASKIENKLVSSLIDPFGLFAAGNIMQYWTVSERNARVLGFEGYLLWNRLLWLGIAALFIAFTCWRFRFQHAGTAGSSRRHRGRTAAQPTGLPAQMEEVVRVQPMPLAHLAIVQIAVRSFLEIVRTVTFLVIILAAIGITAIAVSQSGNIFGTPTYPVTYQVVELVRGTFALFLVLIITFYSGELVWRERGSGMHEMTDTLPVPDWVPLLGKFIGLCMAVASVFVLLMISGMSIQLSKGYTRLEPMLYVREYFGVDLIEYCLLCALAFTVQVVVNHKYLGHLVMLCYYLFLGFASVLGLTHRLLIYGETPSYTYSDMNGFGHFLPPVYWFDAYFASIAVLLLLLARLFWVRGLATDLRSRIALARQRFQRPQRLWAACGGAALFAIGGFIFYNTNIQNVYRPDYEEKHLHVRYEREFSKYKTIPQPKITSVFLNADLDPKRRTVRLSGKYTIVNGNRQAVEAVLVSVPEDFRIRRLEFTPSARMEFEDRPMDVRVYRMQTPFGPGATGTLEFDLEYTPHGFSNAGASASPMVENGTFLNSGVLPHIGYLTDNELQDNDVRRKHGLAGRAGAASIDDPVAMRQPDFANDADWITLEIVVGTSADQTAIAPGELLREWKEGDRRYFHYRTLGKVRNYFPVLSARYKRIHDRWNDVDLDIYYHPAHEYNIAKMMKGMKASLEYCTRNFSPYQNKTLRIAEFPRYGTFAQSFPATIPYSESIGFIAHVDPKKEEDIDYPFYVTAHEVAHQWWAYQVMAANVQGARVLSESLSQYTALMIMKHEFGEERMKRFLKYESDTYLKGRGNDHYGETPLSVVDYKPYIYYNKASIAFYALQDYLGETTVNQVLKKYVSKVAWQEAPYTTSRELVSMLKAVAPDPRVVEDLFERITLYDNHLESAYWREVSKGKYEVTAYMKLRRVHAGSHGDETEANPADHIDYVIFDDQKRVLFKSQVAGYGGANVRKVATVDRQPATAALDPWYKIIQRNRDNTEMKISKQ